MRIDEIVAVLGGGKGPQPAGHPVEAPAGLIGMQDGAVANLLQDTVIVAFQQRGEVLPRYPLH